MLNNHKIRVRITHIIVAIVVIISAIYFIPKRCSVRSTLDAVEFHANGDVDEDVVLDINGAFLQYLLKDDALRYKLTITSPNKSDSDNYTFVSSALNSGDGIWGTAYFYNGYIDGFTSMNMMVWFDPFRIVIYQKEEDRYLIAPASNAEEAIWIKERSDQFFQL